MLQGKLVLWCSENKYSSYHKHYDLLDTRLLSWDVIDLVLVLTPEQFQVKLTILAHHIKVLVIPYNALKSQLKIHRIIKESGAGTFSLDRTRIAPDAQKKVYFQQENWHHTNLEEESFCP